MRHLVSTPERRVGMALAVCVSLAAIAFIIQGLAMLRGDDAHLPDRLLEVTACQPDTYQAPEAIDPDTPPGARGAIYQQGPEQNTDGCAAIGLQVLDLADLEANGIAVAGQVCNTTDVPLSTIVTVEWIEVATGDRYATNVTAIPITYQPGCQRPYDIAWTASPEVLDAMSSSTDPDSRWRIVGSARFVPGTFADGIERSLLWDSVPTFELTQ